MFGRRPDGRALKNIDPIVGLAPYLMPMRCDAQVFLNSKLDYEAMARYIVEQGNRGRKLTFMEILIAAYVRAVSEFPEINRFISNKRLYARTQLTVSFTLLKETGDIDAIEENTVKCYFDPYDTIFDVAQRVSTAIELNRRAEADNSSIRMARLLLNPFLANAFIALARILDRYGILPQVILDASPVHTSMYVTNMASIGMPALNHHIYNFGTTSQFISLGFVNRETSVGPGGKAIRKRSVPIGITVDERICAGAVYARMMERLNHYANHPELLETPPETVRFEEGHVYSLPKKYSDKDNARK